MTGHTSRYRNLTPTRPTTKYSQRTQVELLSRTLHDLQTFITRGNRESRRHQRRPRTISTTTSDNAHLTFRSANPLKPRHSPRQIFFKQRQALRTTQEWFTPVADASNDPELAHQSWTPAAGRTTPGFSRTSPHTCRCRRKRFLPPGCRAVLSYCVRDTSAEYLPASRG